MVVTKLIFYALLLAVVARCKYHEDCYKSTLLRTIPKTHLYYHIQHPVVIGHTGNINSYQENTLEGMESLIRLKAGGMHMQVRMTKDNEVILFGDDDLYRMTGLNYVVRKLPYKEIAKMTLKKNIEYKVSDKKTITKEYDSERQIPLLRDVLKSVKGNRKIIYIELLPGDVPPVGPLDRHRGKELSEKVADIIKELNLQNDVIIVSRDAFKLKALTSYAPDIASGWWIDSSLFTPSKGNSMLKSYREIPDILYFNCFEKTKKNGTLFTEYLLTSGIVSKAVDSSVVDLSMDLYIDNKYPIKTIIKGNYGTRQAGLGAFNIYMWNLTEREKNAPDDFMYIKTALDQGVTRFITNDVPRMQVALHQATGRASGLTGYYMLIMFTILLGKAIITLIFV